MIKLSVIIPVYNAEQYLEQTLDSVLSQSLRDIEVICVDDGSTDSSPEILKRYEALDSRVRVITQKNEYAGAARNKGIAAAVGEYIHFLDADDYVLPHTYEAVYSKAVLHDLDMLKFRGLGYDGTDGCFVSVHDYALNHLPDDAFMRLIDLSRTDRLLWLSYTVWTGIYRTAFLKENGIEFNRLFCVNDRSFSTWVNLTAKRAMLSRDIVVVHRMNMSGSLVGKRSKYFDCLFSSMDITEDILRKTGADQETCASIMARETEDLLHWCRRYAVDARSDNWRQILEDTGRYIKEKTTGENRAYALNKWRGIVNDAQQDTSGREYGKMSPYPFMKEKRESPAASVIVPVLRNDDSLEETLHSLNSQNMENGEFIVVADPGKDIAVNIVKKYQHFDKRITLVDCSSADEEEMIRRGKAAASGKYLMVLEQGDRLKRDCLRLLCARADRNCLGELSFGCTIRYCGEDGDIYLFDRPAEASDRFLKAADAALEEKGWTDEALYVRNIPSWDAALECIDAFDGEGLDSEQRNALVRSSDKDYILFTGKGCSYVLDQVHGYMDGSPDVIILNTRTFVRDVPGRKYRDLWPAQSAVYHAARGCFRPEGSEIFELAKGGLFNKLIRRKFLLENGLFPGEGDVSLLSVLDRAGSVVFTAGQVCTMPENMEAWTPVQQVITGLRNTDAGGYAEQDRLNHCASEVLRSVRNADDCVPAYRFLIEELELDKKPGHYFYDRETAAGIRALSRGPENYFPELIAAYEDSIPLQQAKLDETAESLRDTSRLLHTAYRDKSELNARLQQTYKEKSELNSKLQQTYKEKSEINSKLQQAYKEKSEINSRLQQANMEKAETEKALRDAEAEIARIKNSRSYKVGEALAYIPRKIRGAVKKG